MTVRRLGEDNPDLRQAAVKSIRGRLLSEGRFEDTEAWIDPAPEEAERTAADRERPPGNRHHDPHWGALDAQGWNLRVAPIIAARDRVESARRDDADPADQARTLLALGDAWIAARGELSLPSLPWNLCGSDGHLSDLRRIDNAVTLGFGREAATTNLLRRDEAVPRCWKPIARAAEIAPAGSPAERRALLAILHTMRGISELSPFRTRVAFSRDWDRESQAVCARLQADHPDTAEAEAAHPSHL